MIHADLLTKHYGKFRAIEAVSFRVEPGEIVGFLGPNAAGKTTTMRILTGFFPPTSGRAEIAGYDVRTHPLEVKRRVGYLPESVPLYPEMLVTEFLGYVASVKGVHSSARAKEIDRVVERCGLGAVAGRLIGNLSKGYRQRVGLAQALIGDPPVLILDEPTVGLDPKQVVEIRETIRSLAGDHTVLLSTHILPEVAMVCQRVIIIHNGKIVAQDHMENLTGTSGGATLEVESPGPMAKVEVVLRGVSGVAEVKTIGTGRCRVTLTPGVEGRDAIARALVESGLGLTGLKPYVRTLEEVFLWATGTQEEDVA